MARVLQEDTATMGRPPAENPKDERLSLRIHAELRAAIEEIASAEHRTLAQMTDLLLREAVIARRKAAKKDARDILALP